MHKVSLASVQQHNWLDMFPGSAVISRQLAFEGMGQDTVCVIQHLSWRYQLLYSICPAWNRAVSCSGPLPWEEGMEAAFEREKDKYTALAAACTQAKWRVFTYRGS